MAYDEYGWIVNFDVETQTFRDRGDSCFFMGLQALNFILADRIDLAKKLYAKVKECDFVRHPSVLDKEKAKGYWKNQTSFDMMLIWDYIAYRFGEYGFCPPKFHYRRSKFFWGKFRNPILYNKTIGNIFLSILLFLWKFRKIREYYKENYHKLHLLILYLGTIFEKNKDDFFLYRLQDFVENIEKEYGYVNPFFRFLIYKGVEKKYYKPIHNCCEWAYQRERWYCKYTRNDIIFHQEKCEVDGEEKSLDLAEQFWYLFVLGKKIEYK